MTGLQQHHPHKDTCAANLALAVPLRPLPVVTLVAARAVGDRLLAQEGALLAVRLDAAATLAHDAPPK
jgi:hypothetical protein